MNIQCNHLIEARRPDMTVVNKVERHCIITETDVPSNNWVKEKEKLEKYQNLQRESRRFEICEV